MMETILCLWSVLVIVYVSTIHFRFHIKHKSYFINVSLLAHLIFKWQTNYYSRIFLKWHYTNLSSIILRNYIQINRWKINIRYIVNRDFSKMFIFYILYNIRKYTFVYILEKLVGNFLGDYHEFIYKIILREIKKDHKSS